MRARTLVSLVGAGVALAVVTTSWIDSFAPAQQSAARMGRVDTGHKPPSADRMDPKRGHQPTSDSGGRPVDAHDKMGRHSRMGSGQGEMNGRHRSMSTVSVARLVAPDRPADRRFTLRARQAGPHRYTINGHTPGPALRVRQGDLVQVRLVNVSVPDGVTLHWHGVEVPNAADGVAGVTQNTVRTGGHYIYRFVAHRAGTFWYHSHQLSHEQVLGGLLGSLVVLPRHSQPDVLNAVAVLHLYDGRRTVNGSTHRFRITVPAGKHLRLRLVNTDNGPVPVQVAGAGYRVLAMDGSDLLGPTRVSGRELTLTAGGRADLLLASTPATVAISGIGWVDVNGGARLSGHRQPELDLLSYGRQTGVHLGTAVADRRFRYELGRRPGFVEGRPGLWWTINGKMWPNVPMFMVSRGDVVQMRIINHSGDVHPMHLHGHRVLVLSRNGVASTGSPLWLDSVNVRDGDTYVIRFRANNPGIWMDHCHNLPHAAQGLVAHLMYEGVDTPYRLNKRNAPE